MTPADWKHAIEIHPPGWVCPMQPFWVAGWITSATGLVPVDVRAWLGSTPFLGLCGLPRPDKETAARGRPGPPQAGFSFLLTPVPGATALRIEVCDQHGRWTELSCHAVTATGRSTPPPPTTPGPEPLLRQLRAHHVRPAAEWRGLAREVLVAEIAQTFDVMPSLPFQGALEEIAALAPVQYDRLLVTGWIAHREQRITALTAFLDTNTPLPLVHGLSRPDAGMLFPDLIDGAHARFAGHLPLPAAAPRPLALRIFADLADGSRELVFLKRFRPVLVSGRGADLPPFSPRKFAQAVWALHQAGWGSGWSSGEFCRVLRDAWRDFRVAAPAGRLPPRLPADPVTRPDRPLRVVIVTHNLNYEGAPLFLLEYARHLAAQPGWRVQVVSPQDGPLRSVFAEGGITVRLVDVGSLLDDALDGEFHAALDRLTAPGVWPDADVIVANTLVTFWAVHLAQRLKTPCLFYVHESVNARRFFALKFSRGSLRRVEQAFALATRSVFVAAAAQRPHAALTGRRNFRVLPGWIDLARIQAYAATHDRDACRRALKLPAEAVVFAHIGSMVPRKGQHVFLAAINLLRPPPPPAAPLVFLLVGAKPGPDPYADVLRYELAQQAVSDIRLVAQSTEAYAYFQAADIFVCSSLEEALPRVVLEAAAFVRAIVTTNVDGIPEILGPEDAWFTPPDDAVRLADAMQAALAAHLRGDRRRGEKAQAAVTARFAASALLPRHTDLVRTVAALAAR